MRGPARRVPARAALAALAALAAVAAVAGEGGREGPGKRAVVIGAVNADITVAVGRLPAREETLVAAAPSTSVATGGKGANQAIALARLGAPGAEVEFLGVFAGPRDPHSAMLKASLSRAGVRIDRSFQSGLESGKVGNRRGGRPGPLQRLTPGDERLTAAVAGVRHAGGGRGGGHVGGSPGGQRRLGAGLAGRFPPRPAGRRPAPAPARGT